MATQVVASTTVKLKSKSGAFTAEMEDALIELDRIIEYHARQFAERFDLEVEMEAE